MNTDSGGYAHKSVALSLILSPMKRVQSSPNLATGNDSHSSDLDSWRSSSVTDGLKNGDTSSSSLAAKGFRSVRPNLQDKKSPSQDTEHMPSPPPRRDSFHFSLPGTNPPSYSSLAALANDLSSGLLQFTQSENAVVKETYTIKSTSSYAYSELTEQSPIRVTQQSTPEDDLNNSSAPNISNTQKRKVSTLRLTPLPTADPPTHLNSYRSADSKTTVTAQTTAPKDPTPSKPSPQAASVSVNVAAENSPQPMEKPPPTVGNLEVSCPSPKPTTSTATAQSERPPPAVPPRPSAAHILVQSHS